MDNEIVDAIFSVIREKVNRIVDEETEVAIKRVRKRIEATVDETALTILKSYDVKLQRDKIIITVNKEKVEKPDGQLRDCSNCAYNPDIKMDGKLGCGQEGCYAPEYIYWRKHT